MSNIEIDLAAIEVERQRIRNTYLRPEAQRSASSARGVHHTALLCSDVERTVVASRFFCVSLGPHERPEDYARRGTT